MVKLLNINVRIFILADDRKEKEIQYINLVREFSSLCKFSDTYIKVKGGNANEVILKLVHNPVVLKTFKSKK